MTTQQAAALRTPSGVMPFFANALGVTPCATLGTGGVDKLTIIPSIALEALAKNGITTIAQLATADPFKLAQAVQQAGMTSVTPAQVAGWIAESKTCNTLAHYLLRAV